MMIRSLLERMARDFLAKTDSAIAVVFTDGTRLSSREGPAAIEVRFLNKRAELNTLVFGRWGLIESYISQSIDIRGDLRILIRAAAEMEPDLARAQRKNTYPLLIRLRNFLHEIRHGNRSARQGVENAKAHYDRGTEMFGRYLDPTRTYTCAYWKTGTRDLVTAQQNKLDHVCKKLRLKPGDRKSTRLNSSHYS